MSTGINPQDLTITRREKGDSGEYRARVEGSDAVGRLTWVKRGDARVAEHTIVPKAIGGRGIAGHLVDALVKDAREQGFKIVPQCSYVARKFEQNPDWQDLLV
ncbi:MAG: GNAT family N-acetyltransferase [Pontixanthobacter sp.]